MSIRPKPKHQPCACGCGEMADECMNPRTPYPLGAFTLSHRYSLCTCSQTPPEQWVRYGSAIEPGSQWEPDPECPVHR